MASFVKNLPTATPAQAAAIIAAAKAAGGGPAAAAPEPAPAMAISPGVERWDAKVGGGGSAANVGNVIVDTSVRELGALPRPDELQPDTAAHDDYDDKRVPPVEDTIWRVKVEVTALRLEADGDYHLVLRDESGATMVAEVPNPDSSTDPPFVPADSPFFDDIQSTRAAVDKQFQGVVGAASFVPSPMEPPKPLPTTPGQQAPQFQQRPPKLVPIQTFARSATAFVPGAEAPAQKIDLAQSPPPFAMAVDPTPATVTGVGFFDRAHGQTGNAPNILELHPVLAITFP